MIEHLMEEVQQKLKAAELGVPRTVAFPDVEGKINVAIGMRRTGKTFLLFQKMNQLLKEGHAFTEMLYLNFEDDRLLPMSREALAELIDAFYALFPDNHHKRCFLFLDEIQNVPGWPNLVRRLFDTKNLAIYLSGSSAKLLSREIATSLRGRSLSIEVFPYSLTEYANATATPLPASTKPAGNQTKDQNLRFLKTFLTEGGFPEIQNHTTPLIFKKRILQDYVKGVIFRDIVERHNITNITLIQVLITQILRNPASTSSLHKLFLDFKSQGYKVSKNTLHDYMAYIEDAYLAFWVPLYSTSIRKIQSNPKKVYVIDTGLASEYNLSNKENIGHLFENLIFLDLKRHGLTIHYYLTEERYEVDFLVENLRGQKKLIQVAWNTQNPKTVEHEERAIVKAKAELKVEDAYIVTPETYLTFLNKLTAFSS